MKSRAAWLVLPFVLAALCPCAVPAQEYGTKPRKVQKTEAEWARQLTRPQYLVTRQKVTEPAFSGKYYNNHAKGIYTCVCCDTPLFSSQSKFESGTGWPSFWRPLVPANLDTAMDNSTGEPRVEVICNTCGAHLGHVFSDGPPPTGLRYCINSLALKFVRPTAAKAEPKPSRPQVDAKKDGGKGSSEADGSGTDSSEGQQGSSPSPKE